MKFNEIKDINIEQTISEVKTILAQEKNISPSIKVSINLMIVILELLLRKFKLTSKNSSKPPSTDSKQKSEEGNKKKGAPKGHKGQTLTINEAPDQIIELEVASIHKKGKWKRIGYKTRQVIEIILKKKIVEYRAEEIETEKGRIIAEFPEGVSKPIQYGNSVKAQVVNFNIKQMIPYRRIVEALEEIGIKLSEHFRFFERRA